MERAIIICNSFWNHKLEFCQPSRQARLTTFKFLIEKWITNYYCPTISLYTPTFLSIMLHDVLSHLEKNTFGKKCLLKKKCLKSYKPLIITYTERGEGTTNQLNNTTWNKSGRRLWVGQSNWLLPSPPFRINK